MMKESLAFLCAIYMFNLRRSRYLVLASAGQSARRAMSVIRRALCVALRRVWQLYNVVLMLLMQTSIGYSVIVTARHMMKRTLHRVLALDAPMNRITYKFVILYPDVFAASLRFAAYVWLNQQAGLLDVRNLPPILGSAITVSVSETGDVFTIDLRHKVLISWSSPSRCEEIDCGLLDLDLLDAKTE